MLLLLYDHKIVRSWHRLHAITVLGIPGSELTLFANKLVHAHLPQLTVCVRKTVDAAPRFIVADAGGLHHNARFIMPGFVAALAAFVNSTNCL